MLLGMLGLAGAREAGAIDIPPVDWQGRLEAQFRANKPDNGASSTGQIYTGEIIGNSYVWQPWFGNWRARMAFSKILTDSERDSDGYLFSGDGRLNLFHRSRFPVEAFFNIQDSRVDFEASDVSTDTRAAQVGINHRYTSLGGDKSYQVLAVHDRQEDFSLGSKDQANRLLLTGQMRKDRHNLNASAFLNDRESNIGGFNQLDGQLNLNHSWRPSSHLSVDTNGSLGFVDAESDLADTKGHNARFSSQTLWSDPERPLTARGEVVANSQKISGSGIAGRDLNEVRLTGSLSYLPLPRLRLGAAVRARAFFGDIEERSTSQDLTLDYLSRTYSLGKFGYTWNINGGVRNETFSDAESRQVYVAGIGHDLNRAWQIDWGTTPASISFNAGQRISQEEDTLLGPLTRLENRASINMNANFVGGSGFLQLLGSDTRERGRRETQLSLIQFTGMHSQPLSRFSNFSATYNLNWFLQSRGDLFSEIDDDELEFCFDDDLVTEDLRCDGETIRRTDSSSSLEFTYRHGRLFRVPRLAFESRLRASALSLSLGDYDAEGGELLWDNRLNYRVGKLDVRLRGVAVRRKFDESGNKLVLLSVTRWF